MLSLYLYNFNLFGILGHWLLFFLILPSSLTMSYSHTQETDVWKFYMIWGIVSLLMIITCNGIYTVYVVDSIGGISGVQKKWNHWPFKILMMVNHYEYILLILLWIIPQNIAVYQPLHSSCRGIHIEYTNIESFKRIESGSCTPFGSHSYFNINGQYECGLSSYLY